MATDLQNTLATLDALQRDQDRLRAELALTGLTSFVDRADWLLTHRTPDEVLAEVRKWARLEAIVQHPRAGEKHSLQPVRPCDRCGVDRVVRSGRGGLCRDCRAVMSAAELDHWLGRSAA